MTVLDRVVPHAACNPHYPAAPLRIAVVGCGPKGLFCLERLAYELDKRNTGRSMHISVFEPAEYPGAGLVYNPRQPHYLRMNFAAKHINMWRSEDDGPTLLQWLQRHHPKLASAEQFVPRAIVGEYLHACYQTVIARLSQHATVALLKQSVTGLIEVKSGWDIITKGGRRVECIDEVLLAVGHEGWRAGGAASNRDTPFDIPHVYPTLQQLSPTAALAGSRVALRGIGLTAIDAILALTEGRGGTFRQDSKVWRYQPSMGEPAVIYPYSRSGRPMLAKPISQKMSVPPLANLWRQYASQLVKLAEENRPIHFAEEIWPVVVLAAEDALQASGGIGAGRWFESRLHNRPTAKEFREQLVSSVEVATGVRSPDAAWAVGEAWRRLYPSLVKIISHDGLDAESWPRFRIVASEMERVAFGPPVENCCKLLSLIDCGLVDLAYLQGHVGPHGANSIAIGANHGDAPKSIDHHVNAVLPNPAASHPCGPLSSLAKAGALTPHASGCGYRVDRSGRPITTAGTTLHGLTLVGRPTEGSVLGNDTLNPRLHDQSSRWARCIFQKSRQPEGSAS
ncbi:hypothetical protein Mal64_06710 [Pseudobythopirellula maris]|uniref:FAD-dependent urate hydroxylase HpyO/Asp monooxygenase CreE-like FAD/NAD(P)-binding domain-containing protein n=1 Tax=Pseudobythopirellula maris TaxID=2527991 RepID=A0A5C5ZST3_9BACT|nr:FAD/NAD(P)-binding domain-containing protein [Pseudobythopirellula maris]TWT90286.1 hypothetical protein Mal64_06710 [Pseudobythopirellula maris]